MLYIAGRAFALAALAAGLVHAEDDDKSRKRAERRLLALNTRARKIDPPDRADEPAAFLFRETQRLIQRSREASRSLYEFERMLEAVDDLLDAREDLASAAQGEKDRENVERARDDTAKRLERAYFRVQQGDYFARLSGDQRAPDYVRLTRRLYQKARAAYDTREFRRAGKLASASTELVNVLENLAQVAVRKPEPPVLK
jgi:hypothetical protein